MRVGVVSDSAGDVDALKRAHALLIGELDCGRVFFLGGNWEDVEAALAARPAVPAEQDLAAAFAAALGAEPTPEVPLSLPDHVVRVCEKDGPGGADNQKIMEMLGGQICLLVHNKADLNKDDITNAHLILHGKSKTPGVVKIGTRAFVTPGPVQGDLGCVAVLSTSGSNVDVEFYDLHGRLKAADSLNMASGTRMSAK